MLLLLTQTLLLYSFYLFVSFLSDSSDNPNKHLGILASCDYNKLFVRDTWNAEICQEMAPEEGDVLIHGKRGLSAFPNTTLQSELDKHDIETIVLCGFMANCCVESTMRDACERGYNVVTLVDCVATTSIRGWRAATEITYPLFSTTMRSDTFLANICAQRAAEAVEAVEAVEAAEAARAPSAPQEKEKAPLPPSPPSPPHPFAPWSVRNVDKSNDDIFHFGPWFVDVRISTVGEKHSLRSGAHELRRYLTFAEASGMFVADATATAADGGCAHCSLLSDTIYSKMLPKYVELERKNADGPATACSTGDLGPDRAATDDEASVDAFGWLCNMAVIRLNGGGCVLYSPILDSKQGLEDVVAALEERSLLPIKMIIAPSPQHHLALSVYQTRFPAAIYLCGKASPQMQPLTKKRRDLRFDAVVAATKTGKAEISVPTITGGRKGGELPTWDNVEHVWSELQEVCSVSVLDDRRTGEVILLHHPSKTLVVSDVLYKSTSEVVGPGGKENHYSLPPWFAQGQQELFYAKPSDNSGGLLPAYRTHPRMRTIDLVGMRTSLDYVLGWEFKHAFACHTDLMEGDDARRLLRTAWKWVWDELETE